MTLLPSFLKQKLMHQKIGLCGLYVAVSNTVLFIPDKGGSSVLMTGDKVCQYVVYSQWSWRKYTEYVIQGWRYQSFPVPS